jgi:hypothetical protein
MTERNPKFYSFKGLQRKARQKSGPDREVRAETTLRVEETSWKYGTSLVQRKAKMDAYEITPMTSRAIRI